MDQNKESYNWDNSELDDDGGNTEHNPSPLNYLPAELHVIDLETDYNDTSTVKPEISQSDTERIQDAKNNSVLIPDGNIGRPVVVSTLVDDTTLGKGEPIYAPHDCV